MGAGDLINNYNQSPAAVAGAEAGVKSANDQAADKLKAYLLGEGKEKSAQLGVDTIKKLHDLGMVPEGAGVSAEGVAIQKDPYANATQSMQQERVDQRAHQANIQTLKKDPQTLKMLTQYNNLSGALNNLMNADHLTPQQFDEAQQSIRSNLGIKGITGVGERERSYLNSLGLNADRWNQILSGRPADIDKNNEFVKHVQNLADLEQKNVKSQSEARIKAVTGGNKSLYGRRPDLKGDLDDLVNLTQSQFVAPQQPTAAAAPQEEKPSGLQSFMNRFKPASGAAVATPQVPSFEEFKAMKAAGKL